MANFFARNIDGRGRWLRGITAALLLIAGAMTLESGSWRLWAGLGLLGAGAFVLFEALRGWCLMRACRLRTKL
jgi:hypothetical protein